MHRFLLSSVWILSLVAVGCADQSPRRAAHAHVELANLPVGGHVLPASLVTPSGPRVRMERLPRVAQTHGCPGSMTLMHAIGLALRNSDIVRVAEGNSVSADSSTAYDVGVANANVLAALAEFDASWESQFYTTSITRPPNAFFGPGLTQPNERDEAALSLALNKRWQTGAQTSVSFNPDPTYLFVPESTSSRFNPSYVGQLEVSVRQPLLRGTGLRVNGAPLQITRIESEQSAWEFKKAVMASLRSVVAAYWDLHATHVALQAIDEVVPLLEEVVRLQEESYKTEWVIYADVAKAYAQLYDFRQRRLALQSSLIENELRLRNLLGLAPADGWRIVPIDEPPAVRAIVDSELAVAAAMSYQPDLVRRRLEARIRELELLVARNGLQPNLDFQALYRMNGVGQRLDGTLRQMYSAEFADWLVGFTFSVPLGNRQASAKARAAELQLARANRLLHQESLGVAHRISDNIREIEFTFQEYEQANQRLRAATDWLQGSRLRYENPRPGSGSNWLVQSLNDYLLALRFRTDSASDAAAVLAQYSTAIIELEETKGTLLEFLNINLAGDPCRQSQWLPARPTGDAPFMPSAATNDDGIPSDRPRPHDPPAPSPPFGLQVAGSVPTRVDRTPAVFAPSMLRWPASNQQPSSMTAPALLGR